DQAHGHIRKSDDQFFGIPIGEELLVGPLVAGERFSKAILAVENVTDVVLEAREPSRVAEFCEELPGSICGGEGAVIFAEQNQGLDGVRKSSCDLLVVF